MTFLTIYLAVCAALATQYAVLRIYLWWEWRQYPEPSDEPKPQATYRENTDA